jgi:hypothetical protein
MEPTRCGHLGPCFLGVETAVQEALGRQEAIVLITPEI